MSTNDEKKESEDNESEEKEVTDADLKALKDEVEDVEPDKKGDESEAEDDKADEREEDETDGDKKDTEAEEKETKTDSEDEAFKRKFKNIKGETPEEYAKNLETAYDHSTTEGLKFKKLYEDSQPALKKAEEIAKEGGDFTTVDPALQYARQQMQKDIDKDIAKFSKEYPQVTDPDEYAKLEKEVGIVSRAIRESENRIPTMEEVLDRSAAILRWEKDDSEKLGAALKDSASKGKTNSSTKKSKGSSKVTDAQVKMARNLFPNKKDSEIREELEAYV